MLTVEQKINLLILAGYQSYTNTGSARILNPPLGLVLPSDSVGWRFHRTWGAKETFYTALSWDKQELDTCPDELIYQAIGAHHEG